MVSHLYEDPTDNRNCVLFIAIEEDESRNFYNKRGKLDRLSLEQVDEKLYIASEVSASFRFYAI